MSDCAASHENTVIRHDQSLPLTRGDLAAPQGPPRPPRLTFKDVDEIHELYS